MIKWIKLKKKICNNPSMIDPYRIMNYQAAKKMWRKQGRLSTWEFMEGARIKAAKTPSEWEALTGIKREYKSEKPAAARRWAIALIIIILFSSFMAFTVPGRALAKKLYDVFTTFVGNMLYVQIEPDLDMKMTVPQADLQGSGKRSLSSLEEAYREIDQPVVSFQNSNYILDSIEISSTQARGKIVYLAYHWNDTVIQIKQQWLDGEVTDYNLLLKDAIYKQTNTLAGLTFNGVYTNKDNTYLGCAILNDSTIYVSFSNVDGWDKISRLLEDMVFFSS